MITLLKNHVAAAAVAVSFVTGAAAAQSSIQMAPKSDYLLEEYVAYIGDNDLRNSSGERLTQPWAIIRQDRANFHRYGLNDSQDQDDSFFTSAANRAIMERLLRNGSISPAATRAIVNGDVMIRVSIYGQGNVGHSINVEVAQ